MFFIYKTFADSSEDTLNQNTQKLITEFMFRWVKKDKDKTMLIINQTLSWAKVNIKNLNIQVESMVSMTQFLHAQKDFNILRREFFLMDIRQIARLNKDFSESQKKLHDMLADILGVEIRISQDSSDEIKGSVKKVKKRKIGFRRDD
tara:strand:+ start:1766 stop:2206 length:441 start_codon:yes stop_codon:yes gene_type:complete